jgi:uncharacterized protein (TIGR02996 family)
MIEHLLKALHRSASDEVAWLALADALEEEGDPRAELVRLTTSLRTQRAYHDRAAHEARVQHLIREGMDPCVPRLTVSLKV